MGSTTMYSRGNNLFILWQDKSLVLFLLLLLFILQHIVRPSVYPFCTYYAEAAATAEETLFVWQPTPQQIMDRYWSPALLHLKEVCSVEAPPACHATPSIHPPTQHPGSERMCVGIIFKRANADTQCPRDRKSRANKELCRDTKDLVLATNVPPYHPPRLGIAFFSVCVLNFISKQGGIFSELL